ARANRDRLARVQHLDILRRERVAQLVRSSGVAVRVELLADAPYDGVLNGLERHHGLGEFEREHLDVQRARHLGDKLHGLQFLLPTQFVEQLYSALSPAALRATSSTASLISG